MEHNKEDEVWGGHIAILNLSLSVMRQACMSMKNDEEHLHYNGE